MNEQMKRREILAYRANHAAEAEQRNAVASMRLADERGPGAAGIFCMKPACGYPGFMVAYRVATHPQPGPDGSPAGTFASLLPNRVYYVQCRSDAGYYCTVISGVVVRVEYYNVRALVRRFAGLKGE